MQTCKPKQFNFIPFNHSIVTDNQKTTNAFKNCVVNIDPTLAANSTNPREPVSYVNQYFYAVYC